MRPVASWKGGRCVHERALKRRGKLHPVVGGGGALIMMQGPQPAPQPAVLPMRQRSTELLPHTQGAAPIAVSAQPCAGGRGCAGRGGEAHHQGGEQGGAGGQDAHAQQAVGGADAAGERGPQGLKQPCQSARVGPQLPPP